MKLHSDGVLVIWKWEWVVNTEKHQDSEGCDSVQSDSIAEVEEADNEEKESDDAGPSASSSSTSNITHVVTFMYWCST